MATSKTLCRISPKNLSGFIICMISKKYLCTLPVFLLACTPISMVQKAQSSAANRLFIFPIVPSAIIYEQSKDKFPPNSDRWAKADGIRKVFQAAAKARAKNLLVIEDSAFCAQKMAANDSVSSFRVSYPVAKDSTMIGRKNFLWRIGRLFSSKGHTSSIYEYWLPKKKVLQSKKVDANLVLVVHRINFRALHNNQGFHGDLWRDPVLISKAKYILWDYRSEKPVAHGEAYVKTLAGRFKEKDWKEHFHQIMKAMVAKTPFEFKAIRDRYGRIVDY